MPLKLSILPTEKAITQWNNFVSKQTKEIPYSFNPSLFFFFKKHFHWKPYYFLFYINNIVIGLLPLVNTGKAWVSLPHFSYGGVLTDEYLDIGTIDNIVNEIKRTKLEEGFYKVNIKETKSIDNKFVNKLFIRQYGESDDKNFIKSDKVTYILDLKDKEELFFDIGSDLRRKIKKAEKTGFELKYGGTELLDDFYKVYIKNIIYLKSMAYGKRFFKDLFDTYDFGKITFFVAYYKGKPVGSSLLAGYNGFNENLYFATLKEYRRFYISDWLHWKMINFCIDNSFIKNTVSNSVYSFGRSTEFSSVHQYKIHWPVKVVPLYVYSGIKDYKKNDLLKKIWQYLPYFITGKAGPLLIRHIY